MKRIAWFFVGVAFVLAMIVGSELDEDVRLLRRLKR